MPEGAPRIVIAAGGTAGHVVPALCVADALRDRGAEVEFVGAARAEATLVPEAGYPLHAIRVEGISRTSPLRAARSIVLAAGSLPAAWRLLARLRPAAVMGGGGYVAGPVGLAAAGRRVPLVLTEADSHLGLTNRLLARSARRVCLAFPIAGRGGPRYRVTGRPIPPVSADRDAARDALGVAPGERLVLVFGGSLGARSINRAATSALARREPRELRVLHVAGERDFADLRAPGDHYDLRAYLPLTEFGAALAACDLVVARAGGSIFEIAAHERPAILVPYPHAAGDHQRANARWMADAGAAVILEDEGLTPERLGTAVRDLLSDPARMSGMAAAARAIARPGAAGAVADEVLAAAAGDPEMAVS